MQISAVCDSYKMGHHVTKQITCPMQVQHYFRIKNPVKTECHTEITPSINAQ